MAYELQDKRVLVIGATGGIGSATADAFVKAAQNLPVRRVGQPEDIAEAILLLATNPYMTGTTVTVDGGGTIG